MDIVVAVAGVLLVIVVVVFGGCWRGFNVGLQYHRSYCTYCMYHITQYLFLLRLISPPVTTCCYCRTDIVLSIDAGVKLLSQTIDIVTATAVWPLTLSHVIALDYCRWYVSSFRVHVG